MDLDEYIWRSKRKQYEIAKKVGIDKATLTFYKHRKTTPNLLTALKIWMECEKKIELKTLLSESDAKKFEEWCCNLSDGQL